MDRCALFVDAGYVLTDGAMAARGTSQREAVTWDYGGLLYFLSGLAVDRTGLPMLRCYWYEATVDGRRSSEHDTLADLPGLALRLGRMRPGKREGVDTELHRDLTTLARNRAVSDVVLVSAEDDLAQVIADVQDLGVRVIIVHISVDGNWTLSRALRQQCDDIVEIQGAQLSPYAGVAGGGEPARYSEQYAASSHGGRSMSNGHAATVVGGGHPAMPSGSIGAYPAPPAIYTAPVVADYQQPQPPAVPSAPAAPPRREPEPTPAVDGDPQSRGAHEGGIAAGAPASASQPNQAIIGPPAPPQTPHPQAAQPAAAPPQPPQAQPPQAQPAQIQGQLGQGQLGQGQLGQGQLGQAAQQSQPQPVQQVFAPPQPPAAPAASPAGFREPPAPAQPPAGPEAPPASPHTAMPQSQRSPGHRAPYESSTSTSSFMEPGQFAPAPSSSPAQGQPQEAAQPPAAQPPAPAPSASPQAPAPSASPNQSDQFRAVTAAATSLPSRRAPQGQSPQAQPGSQPSRAQQPPHGQQPQPQAPPASTGYVAVPRQAQYAAAPTASAAPAPAPEQQQSSSQVQAGSSADETVEAAHAEGFDFGESVARDAPALWLEAVLARKPRMPTDLEARLLQGSALPIDSLLHDEVRHALRRGFWDALERSRR